jgi:hypothetical protein
MYIPAGSDFPWPCPPLALATGTNRDSESDKNVTKSANSAMVRCGVCRTQHMQMRFEVLE